MHVIEMENFDRDLGLIDLLTGVDLERLQEALTGFLGTDMRLTDANGNMVLGANTQAPFGNKVPLRVELEPVAWLEGSTEQASLEAAAQLLEQVLKSSARYHMASELHLQSVQDDYEKLQQKHDALMDSESRYKSLAENLEQRVAAQVKTIEGAQRQLYQSEKLASVGQLAAGVAHEINNPIGFVNSNLHTARNYIDKLKTFTDIVENESDAGTIRQYRDEHDIDYVLEDFASLLKESVDGVERVARIVADLKDFSNVDRTEEEVVNINETIRSVCNVAAGQIGEHADISLQLEKLPSTRCQPGHLGQVILNLLLNAAAAMDSNRGNIEIETLVERDEIVIRVSDNGHGIAEENISKVFDPFFTTHDVGGGTGLGLSVCRDIVEAHGGRIEVRSKPGVGTTFTITLPIRD